MKRKIIAVIGGSQPDKLSITHAEEIGALIAQHNCILITGGLGGVMRAASKGAHNAGGTVIGILPGDDPNSANPFVDIPIVTGMGEARNCIIARTCDGAIAVDGKYGTLSEIAYCLIFGKPVVGLNTWQIDAPILKAQTPEESIALLFERIEQ